MKNQIVTAALGLALLNAAHMVASDFTFVKSRRLTASKPTL